MKESESILAAAAKEGEQRLAELKVEERRLDYARRIVSAIEKKIQDNRGK